MIWILICSPLYISHLVLSIVRVCHQSGMTALMHSVVSSLVDITRTLLRAGARRDIICRVRLFSHECVGPCAHHNVCAFTVQHSVYYCLHFTLELRFVNVECRPQAGRNARAYAHLLMQRLHSLADTSRPRPNNAYYDEMRCNRQCIALLEIDDWS